jgi:hypothetical protein
VANRDLAGKTGGVIVRESDTDAVLALRLPAQVVARVNEGRQRQP